MIGTERNWEQFTLLLIDVQEDFWSQQIAESFPDFPANVARLLALCRAEGMEIVHLRARFRPDKLGWMPRYRLRGSIPCVDGTSGVETLPFALEEPDETVIHKQTFDGFQSPELLSHVREKGKRFVLTAGLVTSVCVFLTTASGMQHGFLTAVVEDCCADQPQAHEQALETYQFMFERTTVDLIPTRHSEWLADLKSLDELPAIGP